LKGGGSANDASKDFRGWKRDFPREKSVVGVFCRQAGEKEGLNASPGSKCKSKIDAIGGAADFGFPSGLFSWRVCGRRPWAIKKEAE